MGNSPKKSRTRAYKNSAELARMVEDGDKFAKRAGNELADYAAEAAIRMNGASEHLSVLDNLAAAKRLSTPSPSLANALNEELVTTVRDFEATRKAAEILLQTEATA